MCSRELRGLILGETVLEVQELLERRGLWAKTKDRSDHWRMCVDVLVKAAEAHGIKSAKFEEEMGIFESLGFLRTEGQGIEESGWD